MATFPSTYGGAVFAASLVKVSDNASVSHAESMIDAGDPVIACGDKKTMGASVRVSVTLVLDGPFGLVVGDLDPAAVLGISGVKVSAVAGVLDGVATLALLDDPLDIYIYIDGHVNECKPHLINMTHLLVLVVRTAVPSVDLTCVFDGSVKVGSALRNTVAIKVTPVDQS